MTKNIARLLVLGLLYLLCVSWQEGVEAQRASRPRVQYMVFADPAKAQQSGWYLLFDFDYASDPACATATSLNCLRGHEWYEYDSKGTALKVADIPNPAGASGPSVTIQYPLPAPLTGYGQKTGYLLAVAADGAGARVVGPQTGFVWGRVPGGHKNPKVEKQ